MSCKRNMSALNSNCANTVVSRSGKSVKRYFLALSCTVLVPNHFFCYGPYIQQPRFSSSPSTDSFIQLYKHIPVQKPPLALLTGAPPALHLNSVYCCVCLLDSSSCSLLDSPISVFSFSCAPFASMHLPIFLK